MEDPNEVTLDDSSRAGEQPVSLLEALSGQEGETS